MRKSTPAQWGLRVLVYILGLFCLAVGVALSVNANLGISPVNSLPYVVSKILGTAMSTCVIGIFSFYILLQIVILRKEFKPIHLTQLIFSTIFGYFVDFAKWLLGDFCLPGYGGRLGMLCMSIVVVAVGVVLYIDTELVPMPMEGLALALAKKSGKPFHNVKIVVDCMVVVTGLALSLVCLRRLDGIREGTVIAAIVTGKVIAWVKKPLSPVLQRVCFGAAGEEGQTVRELEELEGAGQE